MHIVTHCNTHHLFGCPLSLYATVWASWTLYSLLVSPFPEHCGSVCVSVCLGRGWHKGKWWSDVRGFAGHHATRCCFILLHYFGNDACKYMTRKRWTWPPIKHASFMYLWLCLFMKNSTVVFTYWQQYVDESNILCISIFYNSGLVDTTYSRYQNCSEMSLHICWNCKSVVALKWLWKSLVDLKWLSWCSCQQINALSTSCRFTDGINTGDA
jgi:hypothetical protein